MKIETQIKLNKFVPRPYQMPFCLDLEEGKHKKYILIFPRRSGKDFSIFNMILRCALRRIGSFFYCLPTFKQARLTIFESITIQGDRFLDCIPKELIKRINSQEMVIELINGSIIRLIGSDTYDTSLVGTNPLMVVFSEFALADDRAYKYVRPILNANEGTVIVASCVAPDTLVLTRDGIRKISTLSSSRDEYSYFNEDIYGLDGFHKAEQFYYGPKQKTLIITLKSGYQLECTPNHPIWDGISWKKAAEWKIDDLLPIQYGQEQWAKGFDISEDFHYIAAKRSKKWIFDIDNVDFFYLLGLIHADGNYDKQTVCVTKKKDQEIIDFLHKYEFRTRPDGMHHEYSSKEFCALLEFIGFKHGARNKEFPEKLLDCNREQFVAFLQGLFDGDGTSNSHPSKHGNIKLTSTCLTFMRTLQVLLLNFGIVSSLYSEEKAPTSKVKVWSTIYNLEITGYFAHIFYREIGFRLERKQKNRKYILEEVKEESGNIYPVDLTGLRLPTGIVANRKRVSRRILAKLHKMRPHLPIAHYLKEKLYYSPIKEIIHSENEVFDFVIPQTHSFFSNGFISHNTPRGMNHFYDLYQIAKNNPEWYCEKLTIDDTQHIPIESIKQDIANGEISEELAQQEYNCSFTMGVEGAYYARYIDKMRLEGRISEVPWEPAFPVHVSMDLGMRDATSLIFFQIIGTVIHIIDCYENHSQGLEHYVRYLQDKPYTYGDVIAPHDIQVRELGTGMSRLEKARELGLSMEIAPTLSVNDGIEAVRSTLPRCWIDEHKCKFLIKALENYRKEYDNKRKVYNDRPYHDNYSHICDALRYGCLMLPRLGKDPSPEELNERYRRVMYGEQNALPRPFQNIR